jgi:L-amino acid N-acyltransferase
MSTITDATEDDLPGILAIYNDVIANSTAVYQEQPVTLADRRAWLQTRTAQGFPVLVTRTESGLVGFASFGDFRAGACYRTTVEHSVHVREDHRGRGIGKALVLALIPRAQAMGKHLMVGGVDADNEASLRMHHSLEFYEVGRFREVGFKFGRWLELVFLQRLLAGA